MKFDNNLKSSSCIFEELIPVWWADTTGTSTSSKKQKLKIPISFS